MFYIGMAVGIIVAMVFGMTLMVLVTRMQKSNNEVINTDLRRFWHASLENQKEQIAAIRNLGGDGLTLKKLKSVFDHHFAPPFLPEKLVDATFINDDILQIRIGPRDIWLNKHGSVPAAGTCLAAADETVAADEQTPKKPIQEPAAKERL